MSIDLRPARSEIDGTPTALRGAMEAEVVPAPIPIAMPRPGIRRAAMRGAQVAALSARYFGPSVGRALLRRDARSPRAARLMFERLGATFLKFGQFVAAAPGIVGESVAEEFRSCLDAGPPVPFDRVRRIVEADLGRPLREAFRAFEERPLAAASIAVVHRAVLHDGTRVAVKVLRPGIERAVATDLAMMEKTARTMAVIGVDQAYNMVSLIVGLRAQIAEELDLRNEARTMEAFRTLFRDFGLSSLAIPHVHGEWSAARVLTMELLDGTPVDDFEDAARRGIDPQPLIRELLRAWVLTGLGAGAFHADIHSGNMLLLRDGRLGMIDWGIVARMEEESRRMFRSLCEASVGREEAWAEMGAVMMDINGPSFRSLGLSDEQITRFVRETFEPVLTQPMKDVSMGELLSTRDDVILKATGEAPVKQGFGDRWRGMREAARIYRLSTANGAFESSTFRMGFLSMKQLIYLERYGRMYLPDESLLGDGEFIRRALDEFPATASV